MSIKPVTGIPFSGFYDSEWSRAIDDEADRFIENEIACKESEHPEPIRLDEQEMVEILLDCMRYSDAYMYFAKEYVVAFNYFCEDYLDFDPKLTFESMTSPRYYNFETDGIFAFIPIDTVHKLFAISEADKHETLSKVIKERFTSYDGFISGYKNQLNSWLAEPLENWDHNEIETLLQACLPIKGVKEGWTYELYDNLNESLMYAFEEGMDFGKWEAKLEEAREEKRQNLDDVEKDLVDKSPTRCDKTDDMFFNERNLK